jgi:hypothetical protein
MFTKKEHEGVLEKPDCERSELTANHRWKASDDNLMPAKIDEDTHAADEKERDLADN